MKIYLAGHGDYGESTYNTLKFFKDDIDNVDYMNFSNHYEEDMEKYLIDNSNEKIVVIVDFLGSSVCACAMKLFKKYSFMLYSGVNISFLLELLFAGDVNEKEINNILEESKKQILYVNDIIRKIKHD